MSTITLDDSSSSPSLKGEWYGVEDEILANDTLRWYVLYLATLLSILLLYIVSWSPGVEWLEIQCEFFFFFKTPFLTMDTVGANPSRTSFEGD